MKNQFNYLTESFVLDSSNPIYCNSHQKNHHKKKQALANKKTRKISFTTLLNFLNLLLLITFTLTHSWVTFTWSKLTIETLEKGVKYVQS